MRIVRTLFIAALALLTLLDVARAQTRDEAAVAAVVDGFHAALRTGDASAAMRLLAADALLLEAGAVQTRAEYERNHLPEDIKFERAVAGTFERPRVVVLGDAAWAISSGDWKGTFEEKPVDMAGVELMVLARDPGGWRIRTIHWSSRNRRPPAR